MARPKLGSTDTERMQLKITAAEIETIDDWRFTNRVPSRSEAVRRLVQAGLMVDAGADRLIAAVGSLMDEVTPQLEGGQPSAVAINPVLAFELAAAIQAAAWPALSLRKSGDIEAAKDEANNLVSAVRLALDGMDRRQISKRTDKEER